MKQIGRKLVFDFGKTIVAIEIYPKQDVTPPYDVPNEKTGILYNIFDIDGEKIEQYAGKSAQYCYGQDMSGHMPKNSPGAWMTQNEWEREIQK